jgi:hypothetical protein
LWQPLGLAPVHGELDGAPSHLIDQLIGEFPASRVSRGISLEASREIFPGRRGFARDFPNRLLRFLTILIWYIKRKMGEKK